jgi:hypothetical protein
MLTKMLRPLVIASLLLVVGVLPVLAEGADDTGVYAVDLKTPLGQIDASGLGADADVAIDVGAARTPDDVYSVDLKLRPSLIVAWGRLVRLGVALEHGIE